MAVKVMVAPAIANGELSKKPAAHKVPAKKPAEPRPKRRRSAVYDAEGNEVFITLICLKCQQIRPLSQFGLRKMADGSIRNQPWCRSCRSATTSKADEQPRAHEGANRAESPVSGESSHEAPSPTPPTAEPTAKPPERRRPGAVAAEVAAALMGGRG